MAEAVAESDSTELDIATPGDESPPGDALAQVEALLKAPQEPAPEREADDAQAAEKPLSLDDLAERLKVDKAKLYEAKVPLADGETRTLGELKDAYRSAEALTKEREAFREERSRHDTEQRQVRQELDIVLGAIPRDVLDRVLTGDVLAKAQQARQAQEQAEREALLKAIPDWSDPVKLTADRQAIEDYVAPFGFTKHDLAGVTDHRLLHLLRAAAVRDRELKAVKAKAPETKAAAKPRANKTPTAAMEHGRLKAAVTMRRISPVAAVEQLLRGNGNGS